MTSTNLLDLDTHTRILTMIVEVRSGDLSYSSISTRYLSIYSRFRPSATRREIKNPPQGPRLIIAIPLVKLDLPSATQAFHPLINHRWEASLGERIEPSRRI